MNGLQASLSLNPVVQDYFKMRTSMTIKSFALTALAVALSVPAVALSVPASAAVISVYDVKNQAKSSSSCG